MRSPTVVLTATPTTVTAQGDGTWLAGAGDAALKASTAQTIGDFARQYAGDPDATDYAGGVLPSPLQNTPGSYQLSLWPGGSSPIAS